MKRRHRLTQRRQFRDVREFRVSASHGCLRVHGAENGGRPLRAGFAITGIRGAVPRNRLRRRLRALLQLRIPALSGVDLVISAGATAAAATFPRIGADLGACLERVVPRALAAPGSRHPPSRPGRP